MKQQPEGERLRLAIRGSGLTVEQAAEKIGITKQTLHGLYHRKLIPEIYRAIIKEKLNIDMIGFNQTTSSIVEEPQSHYQITDQKDFLIEHQQKMIAQQQELIERLIKEKT